MIRYVGDISRNDAAILRNRAKQATSILEFGCGASTQVMAAYKPAATRLVSIDTSEEWIGKTVANLRSLGIDPSTVEFGEYHLFMQQLTGETFDLIFDDGIDKLRLDFAIRAWPHLAVGGALIFHDTRRERDFGNVLKVVGQFWREVRAVVCNHADSNLSIIYKGEPKPYVNWNIAEERQPFEWGEGEVPEDYRALMRASNTPPG